LIVAAAVVFISIIVVVFSQTKVLEKSRNSTRLADLAALNTDIGLYLADGHDFSKLKTGTIYESTASGKAVKNNNGTGWIPLDFTKITSGTPMATLPVDPINDRSDGLYYRFGVNITAKTYELDCFFEDGSDAGKQTSDGGNNPSRFEMGTDLSILP
jgi:hypothetical protein